MCLLNRHNARQFLLFLHPAVHHELGPYLIAVRPDGLKEGTINSSCTSHHAERTDTGQVSAQEILRLEELAILPWMRKWVSEMIEEAGPVEEISRKAQIATSKIVLHLPMKGNAQRLLD
jgi:hypothetical protein